MCVRGGDGGGGRDGVCMCGGGGGVCVCGGGDGGGGGVCVWWWWWWWCVCVLVCVTVCVKSILFYSTHAEKSMESSYKLVIKRNVLKKNPSLALGLYNAKPIASWDGSRRMI